MALGKDGPAPNPRVTLVTLTPAGNLPPYHISRHDTPMNLYRLSELKFTAPYFSAIDCILNGDRKCAIYCSTELTSGLSVYEAMRRHNVRTLDELDTKDKNIYKNVKRANEQAAKSFSASVRATQNNGTIVINPAPLFMSDWGQPEYLAFWDELIRTCVKEIRFNKDWQFSNGCTYEFTVALDEGGIVALDSDGNSLAPDKAISDVEAAVRWLEAQGLSEEPKAKTLRKNFGRLQEVLRAKRQFSMPLPDLKVPEKKF
jgi:hypothetical protein